MRIAFHFALLILAFVIGCGSEDQVTTSIGAAANRGSGTRVALVEHGSFAWERVCILGPYTSNEQVTAITRITDALANAHDIRNRDDINVLMFIRNGHIVRSVAHPRNRGDFGPEVVGRCFSKEQAVFVVRNPPKGSWGNIGPS